MSYASWAKKFQSEAKEDRYLALDDLCNKVYGGSYGQGEEVLHSTIFLLEHLCAVEVCGPNFLSAEFDKLLRQQRYDLSKGPLAYLIAVEFASGDAPARIVIDDPAFTDLSELHESNPIDYLIIYRTDFKKLDASDINTIRISISESVPDESEVNVEFAEDHAIVHFGI